MRAHQLDDATKQNQARDFAVALVGVREMAAEVAERHRPEQRLSDRVRQHVGVGVAAEPSVGLDGDAAQNERPAGDERVEVESQTDACHRNLIRRTRRRSSGVVIFTFSGSPRTTRT